MPMLTLFISTQFTSARIGHEAGTGQVCLLSFSLSPETEQKDWTTSTLVVEKLGFYSTPKKKTTTKTKTATTLLV
jgi:hypothetical protein